MNEWNKMHHQRVTTNNNEQHKSQRHLFMSDFLVSPSMKLEPYSFQPPTFRPENDCDWQPTMSTLTSHDITSIKNSAEVALKLTE